MTNKIAHKIITTNNIEEELQNYASENFISYEKCNFTINKIENYIRRSNNEEFRLFIPDLKEVYRDRNKIIDDNIQIKQYFTITISQKIKQKIRLNYKINYGENSCFPKIVIDNDSFIPYQSYKAKELFIILVQEFNRIKALNKIIVNLYDDTMIKNLKSFTKYIYADKFNKKIQIHLFDGVEPDVTRPSKLIIWYEENNRGHRIKEVEDNEILVEYKKTIYGKNGFNALGRIIGIDDVNNDDDLQLKIDLTTIKIKEEESKKYYISKIKGFVNINDNTLTVDNKVNIDKISRNEETIVTDEDNNIEVFVSQNDTTKDSVGEGVELISETIHVNGHVGANSRLESINLKVDGATHNDSSQFTKNAQVNRLKGTLRCNNAHVKLLEGGVIHATNADVEASLNGSIYAQDVTIGHVKSHLKIFASNSITIDYVEGEDNIFKFNYKEIPILNSRIDFLNEEIDDLKYSLQEAKKHNMTSAHDIAQKIKNLREKIKKIITSTNNAKITIKRPLRGLNTIIFQLYNGEQILYKTSTQKYETFYLEFKEQDEDTNKTEIILHPVNKHFYIKI